MDIQEHLEELGRLKAAIGGTIQTPARKAPYLETDGCHSWWSEERRAFRIKMATGEERIFRTPEAALRWFRVEQ